MTRKRKMGKRNKVNQKQKKLVETRLISINMVIEDYVYNNKRVSVSEAKAYIEEVTSYMMQGVRDPRFLQVIEKITRCMKAIIAEQDDEDTTFVETLAYENSCPSPVYSLPDEDKTFLTQPYDTNIQGKDTEDIETVDLSNDEEDSVIVNKNVLVDVEIHRAMSNLSIRSEEQLPIEYSQSILENFVPVNILKNSIIRNNNTNHIQEINNSKDVSFKQTEFKVKSNTLQNGVPKKQHESQTSAPKDNFNNNSKNNNLTNKESNGSNMKQRNKKPIVKNIQFTEKDVIIIDDSPNKKTMKRKAKKTTQRKANTINPKKVIKRIFKGQKKDDKREEISKKNYINKGPSKVIKPILKNSDSTITRTTCMENSIEDRNLTLFTNNTCPKNNSINRIYNKNIENDLSWVENIRYVREVSNDESDTRLANLDDKFWFNFDISLNFVEKDFD